MSSTIDLPEIILRDLPRHSNLKDASPEDRGSYQNHNDYLLRDKCPRKDSVVDWREFNLRDQYRG